MRLNDAEPAAVVLARLQAHAPVAPERTRNEDDPTYPDRLKAWQDAVRREQHWAAQEAAGQPRGPWPAA